MTDLFDELDGTGTRRVLLLRDRDSGLRAILAIDDLTLGPAMGGIRTRQYPSATEALRDARNLAAAMTLKCAIAGLPAGGAKTVVLQTDDMDRPAAFRRLGEFIEDLGGLYRCAGDLGTTTEDLLNVATTTVHVNTGGDRLGLATGTGLVNCIRAVAALRGRDGLGGLRVAIQGCGLIGGGVARALAREGGRLILADIDAGRAAALAGEVGGVAVPADDILTVEADILAPCAAGGVLTDALVPRIKAWAICGGANNQLARPEVGAALAARGIWYVPDFLASAGAVIDGAARLFDASGDPAPYLARLGATARTVLEIAVRDARPTVEVATALARERIAAARDGKVALEALPALNSMHYRTH